jgi:pimeloyl-ACP methyl ester carboxylesterase
MSMKSRRAWWLLGPWIFGVLALGDMLGAARGDIITFKDGTVLQGVVDRDGTMVQIFDHEGLRRIVIRDTKIEAIRSEAAPRAERFQLVQPLTTHAGQMPPFAVSIESTPWDASGRRTFRYVGTKSGKPIEMTQAINDLGPYAVKYRGVDGFWLGGVATSQVPKEVVLGLLAKVDSSNQDERLRVGRFLIQAEWYPEAREALDRLERDFPDLEETVRTVRGMVLESESRQEWAIIETLAKAHQPRNEERRLAKLLDAPGVPADIAAAARNRSTLLQARTRENRELADAIQRAGAELTADERAGVEPRLLEILHGLDAAPDVARGRLEPFRKAEPSLAAGRRLALALSGWVAGAENAQDEPTWADALWEARGLVARYLSSTAEQTGLRASLIEQLGQTSALREEGRVIDLPVLTAIARAMIPPLNDERAAVPEQVRVIRVHDDPNPGQPSEYAVWLPPEYHPLRSYPAMVILHGPETPAEALAPWISEAARLGVILFAPEYALAGQSRAYRYSPSEHAAVLLAIRDARRRFAIDSDRISLVGSLEGGNMGWDFGLAHPDLFAGVAVVSGLPAKYVWANKSHLALVPMYIAIGDLAPAENELVFEQWARPQITRNYDFIYIKYFRRGLEAFPEEAPRILDWALRRVREPSPKQFEASTSRVSDDRFYGIVARGFSSGRAVSPEAADPLGKNLARPARIKARANAVLNKLVVDVSGINALDVWVGPDQLDFSKRLEVTVNGNTVSRGVPKLGDFTAFLEDLRVRGDRDQTYWLKVPVSLGATRVGRAGS